MMLTIVINAGGESSRMGENKALKLFSGKPLIARMIERLRPVANEMIITTNHPAEFEFLGLPLVPDLLPGMGALGGLYTAVYAASHPAVAVLACDMPFVKAQLIDAEKGLLLRDNADVVIPISPEGLEPLHAVYRKGTCLPAIRAAVESGQRKVISWFGSVNVREMRLDEVAQVDVEFHSFINVNTPEEFREAELLELKLEPRQHH